MGSRDACQRQDGIPRLYPVLTLAALALFGKMAKADAANPHLSINGTGGLSTFKSTMVQSNDTGVTIGYGVRVSSGGHQSFMMGLDREQSTFAFALNSGSIAVEQQDVDLTYRWGPVYLGALFSNSSWLVTAPPDANGDQLLDQDAEADAYLDVLATGYGLKTGMLIEIGRRDVLIFDLKYATMTRTQQTIPEETSTAGITGTSPALGRTAAVGPRLCLNIGGSISLTRQVLSLITGYQYRTYQVSVQDQTFAESHTSTYIGLKADWNF